MQAALGRQKLGLAVLALFAALVIAPTAVATTNACLKITVAADEVVIEKVDCRLDKPFKSDTNSIAKNYVGINHGGISWTVYFEKTVLINVISGLEFIKTDALRLTVKHVFFDNNDNSYSKGIMCWVRHPEEHWWRGGCSKAHNFLYRGVGGVFFVVENENKLGYNSDDVAYLEVLYGSGRRSIVKIPPWIVTARYLVIGDVEKITLKFRDEVGELHVLRLYTSPQTRRPAASLPEGHGQLLYAAAGAAALMLVVAAAAVARAGRR